MLPADPLPREQLQERHALSDVSDVKNVRRPVQTVRSLLLTSVHILIMTNVQIAVHVKKHAQDTLFFKYSLDDPAEEFSLRRIFACWRVHRFIRIDVCFLQIPMLSLGE